MHFQLRKTSEPSFFNAISLVGFTNIAVYDFLLDVQFGSGWFDLGLFLQRVLITN